jgi:hypothetical protein
VSVAANDLADGVVLTGSQFSEPMRIIGNPTAGTRPSTFLGGVTLEVLA